MTPVRRFLPFLVCLATTGCIVQTTNDDDNDDDSGASSPSSGSAQEGSGTDDASTSSADDSTSGGAGPNCSMCTQSDQPDPLCQSLFDPDTGTCVCAEGHEFADPNDPNDFTCVPSEDEPAVCGAPGSNSAADANGDCVCLRGFEWCTNDPDDLTCCESG